MRDFIGVHFVTVYHFGKGMNKGEKLGSWPLLVITSAINESKQERDELIIECMSL